MIIKYDIGEQIFFIDEDSQFVLGWIYERFYDEKENIGYLVGGTVVDNILNNKVRSDSTFITYKFDSNGIKRVSSSTKSLLPVIYKKEHEKG